MSVVPLGDSLDSLLLHTLLVHNIPHDVLSLVDELWCANMLCYIVRSLRRTNIGHPLTLLLMCLAQWDEIISSHLFPLFSVKLLLRGDFSTSKNSCFDTPWHSFIQMHWDFALPMWGLVGLCILLLKIKPQKTTTLMLNKDESFTLSKSKPLTRPTSDPTYVVRLLMQLSW